MMRQLTKSDHNTRHDPEDVFACLVDDETYDRWADGGEDVDETVDDTGLCVNQAKLHLIKHPASQIHMSVTNTYLSQLNLCHKYVYKQGTDKNSQ